MTVSLTGNFLATARCLIYQDGNAITWSFNPNTNQLTAAYTGAGSAGSHNPTATIGLTPVDGTAPTWMTSDSAPALNVTISPTWTGNHVFTPASGNAIVVNAAASAIGINIVGNVTATTSAILQLVDGNAPYRPFRIQVGAIAVGQLDIYDQTAGAARISIKSTGATTLFGNVGINGNSPPTQVTGFGTPVGGAVVANYNITDAGGANSNTNKCVAEILTVLKNFGLIAA